MKKILLLFLFSLIYTTSYGGNLIENTPISGVKKDKGLVLLAAEVAYCMS